MKNVGPEASTRQKSVRQLGAGTLLCDLPASSGALERNCGCYIQFEGVPLGDRQERGRVVTENEACNFEPAKKDEEPGPRMAMQSPRSKRMALT